MKKKRLQLEKLKVQSFVTSLDEEALQDVKGGQQRRAIRKTRHHLPIGIKLHAWTFSEVRSDKIIAKVSKGGNEL